MATWQQIHETALRCDYIYIAYSPSTNLFKIGITNNPCQRISSLRRQAPAMASDWAYHYVTRLAPVKAFEIEQKIAARLGRYNVGRTNKLARYGNNDRDYCYELYQCDIKLIKAEFKEFYMTVPIKSEILNKRFVSFTPIMKMLDWVNLHRKRVELSPMTEAELKASPFYHFAH